MFGTPPSFVTVHGYRLAYSEIQPARPKGTILLLTGLAAKRYSWSRQFEVFGRLYRTIALDHRDVSDSDEVSEPYTIADLADDAAEAMKALGVQRTHVLGISLGGFVALQLAIRHPELVEKLVLISTSAGGKMHAPPSQELQAMLGSSREGVEISEVTRRNYSLIMGPGYAESHPEVLDQMVANARYRPQSPASYLRQLQAGMGHDVTQQLEHIQAPTLIIHGGADPLVVPTNGEYLAQHIKGAKHIVYSNVGHIPIVENTEQFNRDVLAFLEG